MHLFSSYPVCVETFVNGTPGVMYEVSARHAWRAVISLASPFTSISAVCVFGGLKQFFHRATQLSALNAKHNETKINVSCMPEIRLHEICTV